MNDASDAGSAPMLPGLELEPVIGAPSPLRKAVEATLRALTDDQLLEPRHTAVAQLCLELADAVSSGRNSGRASAAAMAAAQLLAALDALPKPAGLDADAEWQRFVEDLRALSPTTPNHADGSMDA